MLRNQMGLSRKSPEEKYVVVLFSLEDFDQFCQYFGHIRGQEVINAMGTYINKHFGSVGGFSARHSKNQFATFLSFSDVHEAERILNNFAVDLQKEGLGAIQTEAHIDAEICFEFGVLAGLAEGKAGVEGIDLVFKEAEANQKEIARVRCERRR